MLKAAERDGELTEVLLLSPELVYQFKLFEHIVAHRRKQKLDIRMPFHHLKSSGVWVPLDKHGEPSTHRSVTTCVRLNPDFRAACLDAEFRQRAAMLLIETYFRTEEQIALREMLGLPADVVIPESESDEKPDTPEHCVFVAETAFDEDSPDQTPLKQMVGRRIRLPREERPWPLSTNLAAHRRLRGF